MTPAALIPLDPRNLSLLWASPERVPDIAALHVRLFDPPWDEDSIGRLIEHPAAAAFVAQVREPKAVAGFVIGQIAADQAEILSIGVAPEWQRRGIARQMVEGLFLEVAADNTAALRLYEGLGFAVAARRKGYYDRPGGAPVDALIHSLAL